MQIDVDSASGSGIPSTLTLVDGIRPVPGDYVRYGTDANGNGLMARIVWVKLYSSVTGGSSLRVGCEASRPPPPPPP